MRMTREVTTGTLVGRKEVGGAVGGAMRGIARGGVAARRKRSLAPVKFCFSTYDCGCVCLSVWVCLYVCGGRGCRWVGTGLKV